VASPSEGALRNTSTQQNQEGEYHEASNVQGNTLNQSTNATERRVSFGASEHISADTSVSAAVPSSSPGAKELQMPQMINLADYNSSETRNHKKRDTHQFQRPPLSWIEESKLLHLPYMQS
jgi:hypothetical protein